MLNHNDHDHDLELAAEGTFCKACNRPSIDCSREPCPTVEAERLKGLCLDCHRPEDECMGNPCYNMRERMPWQVEVTDTFAGRANYCWVNRTRLPKGLKRRSIVRLAKAFAGWTGLRCETYYNSDWIEVRPRNLCQVMFIIYQY